MGSESVGLLFGMSSIWLGPLWLVAVGLVVAVGGVDGAAAWCCGGLAPKVAAIAWTTAKEAMSQPLFYLLLTIGIFGLLLFPFIPYNTLGEDIKMVKDEGLTLIMVLSIILALWTASVSIADEIEGRTALTLLSKPVGRRQFILGKFLGHSRAGGHHVPGAWGRSFWPACRTRWSTTPAKRPCPTRRWRSCQDGDVADRPGLGPGLHGGRGADGHQRGHFHAAADAGQPDHLRVDLRAGPPGADPGQFGGGADRVRAVRGQPAGRRFCPCSTTSTFRPAFRPARRCRGEYLAWAGLYCLLYSSVAMLVALLLFEDRDLA